ncbi:folate-biopterin transporter chloroplastic [Micractinium conductrix]|uniref:Folate-biopterin transporter chloroplastic n=1 Tax=Micractinium conductrix TaxID=554055 RepID=A0A2P6VQS7_9CHLO|nr:folate-biopterin transporter chloroplastic [Micractinium conductrix]|eukprot:PSC76431.1 folate-biopterin transporter chloroplastic [Micractinium conductrix]
MHPARSRWHRGGAAAAGAARRQQWWLPKFVAGPVQPELVAIALVYLVQGLLGLSRLAVFVFLKDELGLAPASVALLTSAGYAPWTIKPLYGFLSDAVPLFGYRRRSYLVLCGLVGASAWGSMALFASTPAAMLALLMLGSASTACADVVADSVVVELVRKPSANRGTAGSLQSLCWASQSTGGIASAYFSGSLVGDYGARWVFGVTAAFPLLVTAAAVTIPEQRIVSPPKGVMRSGSGSSSGSAGGWQRGGSPALPHARHSGVVAAFKNQAALLWATGKQPGILWPAVFVFAWQATPTADTAMLFFETNQLGFMPEILGRIRLVGALASLAGVGLYNFKLKHVPLRTILQWTAVAGTLLGLTQLMLVTGINRQLGLSDQLFALADTALLTVLGQVAFMPLLVLAARICPEGVEATLFATLMSLSNSGMFLGSALGSGLTAWLGVTGENFDNLALLVTLCTLSALLPLPLLRLLPADVDEAKEKEDGGDGSSGDGGERKES